MSERIACPACGSRLFMRAIDVVEVRIRLGLWAWMSGVIDEQRMALNAVCASPNCPDKGEPLRIDRDGVRRLREGPRIATAASPPPVEKPPREPIEINRTPGLAWTREGRG